MILLPQRVFAERNLAEIVVVVIEWAIRVMAMGKALAEGVIGKAVDRCVPSRVVVRHEAFLAGLRALRDLSGLIGA